jgi:hypothetical protein
VNVAATEQVEFAAKLTPHVVPEVRANSAAFAPPSFNVNPLKVLVPELVSVIDCGPLGAPCTIFPKKIDEADRIKVTLGGAWLTVNVRVLDEFAKKLAELPG